MAEAKQYDAIVVGAGQGGSPLAKAMADKGWKVALVEKEAVGGTCINTGCTPTKTMVASARVAQMVRRAGEYGVDVEDFTINLGKVRQRRRAIVEMFRTSSEATLEKHEGLDLIYGQAAFVGPQTLEVNGEALFGEKIFLDVGARPRRPEIEGCGGAYDSASILEMGEVPEHLLIIGAGYVGLEFGQMFRRFGSQVTIINHTPDVLRHEDRDVAEALLDLLRSDGVDIRLATSVERVEGGYAQLSDGTRLPCPAILMAAGRLPETEGLNLEVAGVEADDRGFIRVDERLQTSAPNIWAIGDCKGGPAFTHISYDDYRILKTNLLEGGDATTAGRYVPYTMFVDPQLGRVGLTEEEAKEHGHEVRIASMPMSHVARALETDETRGFMKVVVDRENDQILGCAILGIEGGELMSMIEIAMMGKLPYTALENATFAHPTLAESLNNVFGTLTSRRQSASSR